jgi:hypothetical protein
MIQRLNNTKLNAFRVCLKLYAGERNLILGSKKSGLISA